MNIQGLDFIKKSKNAGNGTSPDIDVSITMQSKQRYFSFSFSENAYALMGKPKALVAAYAEGRIYLMESSPKTGFVCSKNTTVYRVSCRFPINQLKIEKPIIGYYPLKWSKERDLFYVALSERNTQYGV